MKDKKWLKIEEIFSTVLAKYKENGALGISSELLSLSGALHTIYPQYNFSISVVDKKPNATSYIMSVYPTRNTIDLILNAIWEKKDNEVVAELWKKNKDWVIEIEAETLNGNYNAGELTALLTHEIGHVILSNDIIHRINSILQYSIAKSSMEDKMSLRNKVFRIILSIPVLDACIMDKSKGASGIKEEIKADLLTKKNGYDKELYSALDKTYQALKNNPSFDKSVETSADFSIETLSNIRRRQNKLAKSNLFRLMESCGSTYGTEVLEDIYEYFFATHEGDDEFKRTSVVQEKMDSTIQEGIVTEFFSFGKKKLARLDPADFDYITVRSQNIRNENDKMLLIGYIHSKLDIIDYYLSILTSNNPNDKKIFVPHTIDELNHYKKILNDRRAFILSYKIPEKSSKFLVAWPEGYEG